MRNDLYEFSQILISNLMRNDQNEFGQIDYKHRRKQGHSTGPKDPRLQKSFGVPKRTCCRQPGSSIPSCYTSEDSPGAP